ncbi:MAG TPA: BPSL0067 family protein [Acetobacteraceae bacterium]|jgi:hypothetical protein
MHLATKLDEIALGDVIGDGHCVALVRHAADLGHTSTWRRGGAVLGAGLERGTCIATFSDEGRYENRTDGASHACVFLEESGNAIRVLDQWKGKRVSERVIRAKNGAGTANDDADRYFVIET